MKNFREFDATFLKLDDLVREIDTLTDLRCVRDYVQNLTETLDGVERIINGS